MKIDRIDQGMDEDPTDLGGADSGINAPNG